MGEKKTCTYRQAQAGLQSLGVLMQTFVMSVGPGSTENGVRVARLIGVLDREVQPLEAMNSQLMSKHSELDKETDKYRFGGAEKKAAFQQDWAEILDAKIDGFEFTPIQVTEKIIQGVVTADVEALPGIVPFVQYTGP